MTTDNENTVILKKRDLEHSGIDTFQKNLIPELENKMDTQVEEYEILTRYPFSTTISRLLVGRKLKKLGQEYDKIFLPSQTLLTTNPENIDAKIIVYVHDILPVTTNFSGWLATPLAKHYTGNLEKAGTIISASEKTKKEILERTRYSGDVTVAYQGVEKERKHDYYNGVVNSRQIDLLYVGSLIDRKNPEFVKKVFREADRRGLNVTWVSKDRLDLPGMGYINPTDEKLGRIYARSKYYLHASKQEGFGRTPVEAQLNGCVPIALDNSINNEILGVKNMAWLPFNRSTNPSDIVDMVENNDESWEDLSIEAIGNATPYTWTKCAELVKRCILNA